jgi:hypothetical protein
MPRGPKGEKRPTDVIGAAVPADRQIINLLGRDDERRHPLEVRRTYLTDIGVRPAQ